MPAAKQKVSRAPNDARRRGSRPPEGSRGRPKWIWLAGAFAGLLVVGGAVWAVSSTTRAADSGEAPEAEKILSVQAEMPFQIMIPGYLPEEFDRESVEVKIDQTGPAGEPMVELAYSSREEGGPRLYVREWVPGNPELETLAGSKPIETKWGKGWLLLHKRLIAIWADVGATRVSVFTPSVDQLTKEQVLAMAENLGPASNKQVFSFIVETPEVSALEAPDPVVVPVGDDGVQEVTLVVTPGGYDPLRFSVEKDVPVRLIFKQLGQVGCGNELIFPSDPANPVALKLDAETTEEVYEFTPAETGEYEYFCAHRMYRGLLEVRDE